MFTETLAPATKELLQNLSGKTWIKKYYLAGGTALALHYGHRQSVDLDWFTTEHINIAQLLKKLSTVGPVEILNREDDTLEALVAGVKISFMTYPYPVLKKAVKYISNVTLAAPIDIALMKLGAIADRNTRKDFIDLYVFLEREQMKLSDLFEYLPKKFQGIAYDRYHLLKALTYFKDADNEAMPKILLKLDWKKVRQFFIDEVRRVA